MGLPNLAKGWSPDCVRFELFGSTMECGLGTRATRVSCVSNRRVRTRSENQGSFSVRRGEWAISGRQGAKSAIVQSSVSCSRSQITREIGVVVDAGRQIAIQGLFWAIHAWKEDRIYFRKLHDSLTLKSRDAVVVPPQGLRGAFSVQHGFRAIFRGQGVMWASLGLSEAPFSWKTKHAVTAN